MLLIFASAFLISTAHAATRPKVEVSFANYGRALVEYQGEQPGYYWNYHAVGLVSFQWRLSHQWQGRRDTFALAFLGKRIGFDEEGSRFFQSGHRIALFPGYFELGWTRRWGRSLQTRLLLMPAITAEDSARKNRYTAWGELLVQHKGLGLGAGRLEVSGRLRWWPLLFFCQQWHGIRVEGLIPRYLDIQKGLLALRARLEGATYLMRPDPEEEFLTLYFSQLDLGVALVASEGPLTIDLEIGRTIQRRFEVEHYRGIDDGWYIRTNLKGE